MSISYRYTQLHTHGSQHKKQEKRKVIIGFKAFQWLAQLLKCLKLFFVTLLLLLSLSPSLCTFKIQNKKISIIYTHNHTRSTSTEISLHCCVKVYYLILWLCVLKRKWKILYMSSVFLIENKQEDSETQHTTKTLYSPLMTLYQTKIVSSALQISDIIKLNVCIIRLMFKLRLCMFV